MTFPEPLTVAVAPSVVAFASVVVAAFAIRANRDTTKMTLRQQRTLAQEERLWHQRSEAYLELLIWLDEMDQQFAMTTGEPSSMLLPKERQEYHRATFAKLKAYGSKDVVELVAAWRSCNASFTMLWQELLRAKRQIEEVTDDKDAIRRALFQELEYFKGEVSKLQPGLEDSGKDLEDAIRKELIDGYSA